MKYYDFYIDVLVYRAKSYSLYLKRDVCYGQVDGCVATESCYDSQSALDEAIASLGNGSFESIVSTRLACLKRDLNVEDEVEAKAEIARLEALLSKIMAFRLKKT